MLASARLVGQTTGAAAMALLFHTAGNPTRTAFLLAGALAFAGAAVSAARLGLPLPEGVGGRTDRR